MSLLIEEGRGKIREGRGEDWGLALLVLVTAASACSRWVAGKEFKGCWELCPR